MYIIWLPSSWLHGWHLAKLPTGGPHEGFVSSGYVDYLGVLLGLKGGGERQIERERKKKRERERREREREIQADTD